jgi:hypothetical protein
MDLPHICKKNWTLTLRFQVSGVSIKKVRAGLKPDTRHPWPRPNFV